MARPHRRPKQTPLGAHQSIAGGYHRAVERAVETGCECLQIFTRNINQWAVTPIDPAAAAAFKAAVRQAGLACVVAHDSYLINPAAADPALRRKSIAGLVTELERAEQLGIRWVVAHPGAAGEQPAARPLVRSSAAAIPSAARATAGAGGGARACESVRGRKADSLRPFRRGESPAIRIHFRLSHSLAYT